MKRPGYCLIFFVALWLSPGSEANSSRLTVVSEILDTAPRAPTSIALYLSRLGTYFAELYLEHPEGSHDATSAALDVSILVTFLNGEKNVFEREVAVHFTPQKRVATLFYVDAPSDLPQRRNLEMQVTVIPITQSAIDPATNLRIQLTRKPQFLLFPR